MIAISSGNPWCGNWNTACSRTCCCHCCSSSATDSITVTITNCEQPQYPEIDVEKISKHDYQAIIELEWIAFLMRVFRLAEKSSAYPLAPDVMRKRLDPKNKGPPVDRSPRR